jgi:hypothetical protein
MLRPNFDKRFFRITPQFVRNRLAFRSPIRSYNTNLEDNQMAYDIHNLASQLESFKLDMKEKNSFIEEEKNIGSDNSIILIRALIDNMDKRLKLLEGK